MGQRDKNWVCEDILWKGLKKARNGRRSKQSNTQEIISLLKTRREYRASLPMKLNRCSQGFTMWHKFISLSNLPCPYSFKSNPVLSILFNNFLQASSLLDHFLLKDMRQEGKWGFSPGKVFSLGVFFYIYLGTIHRLHHLPSCLSWSLVKTPL